MNGKMKRNKRPLIFGIEKSGTASKKDEDTVKMAARITEQWSIMIVKCRTISFKNKYRKRGEDIIKETMVEHFP